MTIRVLIADDHPLVRDGLRFSLERAGHDISVVAEAADGLEALKLASTCPADVFVLDITMPFLNGLEITRKLISGNPGARVIILSVHDSRAVVEEGLAAGARGYLTKDTAGINVVDAVREVHKGRFYISPDIAHYLVEKAINPKNRPHRNASGAARLTVREKTILQLVADGLTEKEIAGRLEISLNTVHTHKKNLMAKLDMHKQANLVRFAIKEGMVK